MHTYVRMHVLVECKLTHTQARKHTTFFYYKTHMHLHMYKEATRDFVFIICRRLYIYVYKMYRVK